MKKSRTRLISASRCAGSGGEVVVAGELEQAGVELDGGAAAVEDGASEVVVDEGASDAAQGVEGVDVSAEEALEGLVEGEEGGDGTGVARTMTNPETGRVPCPMRTLPKEPQSTWACLAGEGDDPTVDGPAGLGPQVSSDTQN